MYDKAIQFASIFDNQDHYDDDLSLNEMKKMKEIRLFLNNSN